MSQDDEKYPASAVASWSGYVYQGKIALYHSLKLILNGDLDFELQLDSSDDFAIYKEGKIQSAHQIKAKISKYRSGYKTALEQSTLIEFDKIKGTNRHFHVSIPLDDTSDYLGASGETVKFYSYGDNLYCGLGEVEDLTKELIKNICNNQKIPFSEKLINFNYCLLSEKISSKAVQIHKLIQEDRVAANQAAYEGRIKAEEILDGIIVDNPYDDKVYFSVELKARLQAHLEERLDQALPTMIDATYKRALDLCDLIRSTQANQLQKLCQMIKPSERFRDVQTADIRRYTKLIQTMSIDPIFDHLPHYLDSENRFYVPTALDVDEKEECEADIIREMTNNRDLLRVLFEYNNLIASKSTHSFTFDTRFTNSDDLSKTETVRNIESNIVKSLCISVVTQDDAEEKLNDKTTH